MWRMLMLFGLLGVFVQPLPAMTANDAPEPLKPWVKWVLEDDKQHGCPFYHSDFQSRRCSWSGVLALDLHARQGNFNTEWTLYRQDWIELPGDSQHWPQQVTINKQAALVVEHDGKPAINMPAGHYQISGQLLWDKLPESLAIPAAMGLLQLNIDGLAIANPAVKDGALWLKSVSETAKKANGEQNHLDLQVFRQVIDDAPMQVLTLLELEVSGEVREIGLPHALLDGFIPIELFSPLPARLEHDGQLRVQVRPGRWSIQLNARNPLPLQQLGLHVEDASWPEAELWAFRAMPALRLVEIENLPAIDGSQTNLPAEWQQLPAYQLKQGDTMLFKTIRRGDPEPAPNQLNLKRRLWLDFDGKGYSISDQMGGVMSRDWRLDALPETELGQVVLNGQSQLITQSPSASQRGVEVRHGQIQLNADSRMSGDIGRFSAVGWQQQVQQLSAELNIPPGWRLLAVSGVDNVPDSWLTRWTLLDLFLVLIASLAASRLWCWQWGAFALVGLALIWHEADAPRLIWLNCLAALALLRVLPDTRFTRWVLGYRNLCWASLLIIAIPFMIAQVRIGLYPQLEFAEQSVTDSPSYPAAPMPMSAEPMGAIGDAAESVQRPAEEKLARAVPYANPGKNRGYASVMNSYQNKAELDRIDPDANLQTGPGLPQWRWHSVNLAWNGAVDSRQQLSLWYLPPWLTRLLHFCQALLVVILALPLFGLSGKPWRWTLPGLPVLLLLPLLSLPSQDAYADFPDQALLEQLKSRLLEAPQCLPNCAQIARMSVQIKADDLRIDLQAHAQQSVAIPLPAQFEQWWPQQVNVDGKSAEALIRQHDGSLWLALEPGVHQVQLQGHPGPQYKFHVPLPLAPQYSEVQADGWQVDGLYENGKTGSQLEFSRLNADRQKPAATTAQTVDLPAFVQVERSLQLGLDWRVITRVQQRSANAAAVVLEVPLLKGESVTTANMHVKNDKVLVNMAAGQSSLVWQSRLEKSDRIELTAPDTTQWTEVWQADVSPVWHMQAEGIAAVHHQDQQGRWLPEWRPWPGEKLSLMISRPAAVAGPTLTIDKSQLQLKPGKRSQSAELTLSLRSSKGGQHTITLPNQAVLQTVAIDGVSQPIRQKAATVTLPIHPGQQTIVLNWQENREQSLLLTTPQVDLGSVSVNSHIQVSSGQDRWILMTLGPSFGPAVLFWGVLWVMAGMAFGLGKVTLTPLRHWQWFLLLIGLSQIDIAAGLVVIAWLLALGVRARKQAASPRTFNMIQLALALLTVLSLVLLFGAVEHGLLGLPDMQITGNQSTAYALNWYQDHSAALLPAATVLSVPLLLYRLLMLLWSLWMAIALLNWLRWGWDCYVSAGLWRKKSDKPTANDS